MRFYVALSFIFLVALWSCQSEVATEEADQPVYEPTYESLSQHPTPSWYDDGKLGIFVCWGLYSVPGWAQGTELTFEETIAKDGGATWFAENPYAEWYLNSLKIEGSATQAYHQATFGPDFSYYDFIPEFNRESGKWDPREMASLFKDVGAAYVVLVTKFHDGFLLWPSDTPNPERTDYIAERDIVGELTEAVKAEGMRMGFYYSSGLDWTFNDHTIKDLQGLFQAIPQDTAYVAYIDAHWRELMERYDPAILWADIGSPEAFDPHPLIADFYNRNQEGVVNNRHKMQLSAEGFVSPVHYDFSTPEYQVLDTISPKKWETVRGIGLSFGYNRTEDVSEFASIDELVDMFVDIVSKNGNLLLNVGPAADGSISEGQKERLLGLGNWLGVNEEAIRGTRPWEIAQLTAADGTPVRFTRKGDAVYLIALDRPANGLLELSGMPIDRIGSITALQDEAPVDFSFADGRLQFRIEGDESEAYAFRLQQ